MHVTSVIIKQCITFILKTIIIRNMKGVQFCCKLYDYKASHINATTKMNALKNTAFYTVVKKVAMTKYVQRFKLTFN